jgi:hypothetical protein
MYSIINTIVLDIIHCHISYLKQYISKTGWSPRDQGALTELSPLDKVDRTGDRNYLYLLLELSIFHVKTETI